MISTRHIPFRGDIIDIVPSYENDTEFELNFLGILLIELVLLILLREKLRNPLMTIQYSRKAFCNIPGIP